MGRRIKRGTQGNVAQYLTRTQAVRKLQIPLSSFRRLCILKGIHPREPKKKVKGANKTYYHVKDINWLMHEPLLQIFRNMKAHYKKVRKAKAKFNNELAERLKKLAPTYKLDHLVRERYPSFVDALRDLDDPLTMVHLFATLPAEKRYNIPTKAIDTARRLVLEWTAWVVRTASLRKVFVAVKGFYFQAEVMGQPVTWLVPHQLAQVLPTDVDYRVMLTFLEFYETMLQFVNFKLYHGLSLKYPPLLDPRLEETAVGLAEVMRQLAGVASVQAAQTEEQSAALKSLEAPKPRAPAVQENGSSGSGKAGGAKSSGTGARAGKTQGGADDEEGSEPLDIDSGGSDEDEEVDSQAGSEDEGSEVLIDSGSDDDDEEEEEDDDDDGDGQAGEEEDDEMDPVMVAARKASSAGASTSAPSSAADRALVAAGGQDGGLLESGGVDGVQAAGGALGGGVQADDEAALCGSLFKGLVFFLSREVPREQLAFVIRAFGGVAAWDGTGSPLDEADESITHQVVDRPTQGHRFLARSYVQPQWVFDSANFRVLMPASLYVPGKVPPPHLSPFVNNEEEGYTPEWAKQVKQLQDAARAARMRAGGQLLSGEFVGEEGGALALASGGTADGSAAAAAAERGAAAAEAAVLEAIEAAERQHAADLAREMGEAAGTEGGETEEMETDGQQGGSEEPEAAAAAGSKPKRGKRSAAEVAAQEAADVQAMKDIMMTRKNRKLYERINRAVEGKRERVEALETKKKELQKKGAVGATGQLEAPITPAAQKAAAKQQQQKAGSSGPAAANGKSKRQEQQQAAPAAKQKKQRRA